MPKRNFRSARRRQAGVFEQLLEEALEALPARLREPAPEALVEELGWSFVVTFKKGRTPTLWREFQALLPACPENVVRRSWGDGRAQQFRWVNRLDYEDSEQRHWRLNALEW